MEVFLGRPHTSVDCLKCREVQARLRLKKTMQNTYCNGDC